MTADVIPIRPRRDPAEDPAAVIMTEGPKVQAAANQAPFPPLDLAEITEARDRLAGVPSESTTRAFAMLDALVEYLHAQPCVELDSGATFAVVPIDRKETP